MSSKLFLVLIFLSASLSASTVEDSVRAHITKKFRVKSIILNEDRSLPFSGSHLFRVRDLTGSRGWTVLVDEKGRVKDVNKNSLKTFLRSLETGLKSMNMKSGDEVRITNGLLNHLTTARRSVSCHPEKALTLCDVGIPEGNLAGQSVKLLFNFEKGSVTLK